MDHFEGELARMMRDSQEHTPFGPQHQRRLRSGVRARHRARVAQRAVGSALAVAGLGLGFLLLPHDTVETRPQAPLPRPATSPAPSSSATRVPDGSPTEPSMPPPTGTADATAGGGGTPSHMPTTPVEGSGATTDMPATPGSSTRVPSSPDSSVTTPPPTSEATLSPPPTP